MDEREKRDAEINKALEEAQKLIQGSDTVQIQNHEDDIDDIINMVKVKINWKFSDTQWNKLRG